MCERTFVDFILWGIVRGRPSSADRGGTMPTDNLQLRPRHDIRCRRRDRSPKSGPDKVPLGNNTSEMDAFTPLITGHLVELLDEHFPPVSNVPIVLDVPVDDLSLGGALNILGIVAEHLSDSQRDRARGIPMRLIGVSNDDLSL